MERDDYTSDEYVKYVLRELASWLRDRILDLIPEDDKPATQTRIDLAENTVRMMDKAGFAGREGRR